MHGTGARIIIPRPKRDEHIFTWAFGEEAMNFFTRHYRKLTNIDYTNLPLWDLWAAHKAGLQIGNWGLDAEAGAKILPGLHRFAQLALSEVV